MDLASCYRPQTIFITVLATRHPLPLACLRESREFDSLRGNQFKVDARVALPSVTWLGGNNVGSFPTAS